MKKHLPYPFVLLFAAFFGFWMRGWMEEWKIDRQFEQARACFSADGTDFTLVLNSPYSENRSVYSYQLTYKQKKVVEEYIHSLKFKRFHGYPVGGEGIMVQYWLPSGDSFRAGGISTLYGFYSGRDYHLSGKSSQPDLYRRLREVFENPTHPVQEYPGVVRTTPS